MFPLIPVDSQTGHFGDYGLPFHGLFTLLHQDAHAQFNTVIPEDRSFLTTHVLDIGGSPVILGYPDWSGAGPHQAPFEPENKNHRKFPNTNNSRKIVVPGHTYERGEEFAERDQFLGVDFRSFAIANDRFIGGFANSAPPDGWVYPAPDGSRWNITLNASISTPDWAVWTVQAFPYGRSRFANSFYGVSNVPDEQTGETASFTIVSEGASGISDFENLISSSIVLMDIHENGAKAIFGLGGGNNAGLYPNFNPFDTGSVPNQRKAIVKADGQRQVPGAQMIWEVTFTGTPGVDWEVSIVVVRDQETCTGNVLKNVWEDTGLTTYWGSANFITCRPIGFPLFGRPNTLEICPPGQLSSYPATGGHISLFSGDGDIAAACGWTRTLDDGTNVINDPTNEYLNFKEWTFTNQGIDQIWPEWQASKEYVAGENVNYNGIIFNALFDHTSNENFQPGVGVLWTAMWEIPYTDLNHDVADVPVWAEATSYNKSDAVREGATDYWLAKGQFVSFDSDPELEQTNHDQPNTGDNFEAFWDGPFNILLNPTWLPGKVILEDWIIESTYTDPAFPTLNTITLAHWKCIRTHVSVDGGGGNKPGVSDHWHQYWEKAISEEFGNPWEAPIEYVQGSKVSHEFEDDTLLWEATGDHVATAANQPPSGEWTENTSDDNCFIESLTNLRASLQQVSYHVKGHQSSEQHVDFHVEKICAGAMYKENGDIKIIETDVHYTRDLEDKIFDLSWVGNDTMNPVDPGPNGTFTGSITRGPAFSNETFEYKFRVDGAVKQTIVMTANATAQGSDQWTEQFSSYPLSWEPSSTRTLVVTLQGVELANISETFDISDTQFGGATGDDIKMQNKANWGSEGFSNDFAAGVTFRYIRQPVMEAIWQKLELNSTQLGDFAGAGLMNWTGGGVTLDPISTFDQYGSKRPDRTQEMIDNGEPFPTLITCWYGKKLVGPLTYGRKSHSGIALDSQYLNVMENDDFPWVQYGIYGPDNEQDNIITLTHTSPDETPLSLWLLNADYGDDIACAYDPITKAIHRNSQYRVVYI